MTYKELINQYNQLVVEENVIPQKINEILSSIQPLKDKVAELERLTKNEDLKISEKPPQAYQKVCGSAFLGIGKSCRQVPVPNPEVAREVKYRNDLIKQRNTIIQQIEANLKQVADLTKRQINIEEQQISIRSSIIDLDKKILQEPFNVLNTLGRAIKSLFTKEQFKEAIKETKQVVEDRQIEKEKIIELLPYWAVISAILFLFLKRRQNEV